jgi:DNA mismatch repair protein MutS
VAPQTLSLDRFYPFILLFSQVAEVPGIRAMHMSVRFKDGVLFFDRKLAEGSGPPTYGLEVCRSLDMDPAFMRDAESIRAHVLSADRGASMGGADGTQTSQQSPLRFKPSRYNRRMLLGLCPVCDATAAAATEAEDSHHIDEQADPESRRKRPTGLLMNRRENLAGLCVKCHKETHSGGIKIYGYVSTSNGSVLEWVRGDPAGSGKETGVPFEHPQQDREGQ